VESSPPRLSAREVCVRLIGPHGGLHTARHGKGLVSAGRFTRKNGAMAEPHFGIRTGGYGPPVPHTRPWLPPGLGTIGFKPSWKTKTNGPGMFLGPGPWPKNRGTGLPVHAPVPTRGPDARKPPRGLNVGSSGARGFIQRPCAGEPVTMTHVILTRAQCAARWV